MDKLTLLMKSLTRFYAGNCYIDTVKEIVTQRSDISLRVLDWFITNYSKKYRIVIEKKNGELVDVYIRYKLMLKSFSKSTFDPFCRKNKILFYYNETDCIETSCGQLCFFKWCFENDILDYVRANLEEIEKNMKGKKTKRNKCNFGRLASSKLVF